MKRILTLLITVTLIGSGLLNAGASAAGRAEPPKSEQTAKEAPIADPNRVPVGSIPTTDFRQPGIGVVDTNVWAGHDSRGYYVSFSKVDQQAIAAGATVILGIAICSAAPWACPVVGVILAVAGVYIAAYGVCTRDRRLRVYQNRTARCV